MTGDSPLCRFELIAAELRALRMVLVRLPGEYSVNYQNGKDETAVFIDDIEEALTAGRAMARAVPSATAQVGPTPRRRFRRRMTPKAIRRRMIRAHNRRMRARALKCHGSARH
jgi:hypothetical protein